MNVADKDLCRELYELSGWNGMYFLWVETANETRVWRADNQFSLDEAGVSPAYDLGYLLRKLPARIKMIEGDDVFLTIEKFNNLNDGPARYSAYYRADVDSDAWCQNADTPENAACKLAIELFNQGVLKREDTPNE